MLLAGGVAVGLAMALYFSISSAPPPSQETKQAKPEAKPPVAVPLPPPGPAPAKEEAKPATPPGAAAQADSPAQETETSANHDAVTARLAELGKENKIMEDVGVSVVEADAESGEPHPAEPAVKEPQARAKEPVKTASARVKAPAKGKKPKKTAPSQEAGKYTVQMISTADALKALETRDRLASAGYQPWIATGTANINVFRVEVGVFGSIKEAAGFSARMAAAGFPNRPAYLAGGSRVTLALGTFTTEDDAARLTRKATSAGYDARLRRVSDTKKLYMVRVGRYQTKGEAHDAMVSIRKGGFIPMGVSGK